MPASTGPVKKSNTEFVNQRIVVMGPGNLLALEDIARMQEHSYSAKCVSQTGTILMIEVDKFHQIIKHIPNGFSEITRINKNKWKSFFDKLTILEENKNQLEVLDRELVTTKNDRFSNLEFFKATYFEQKLN